MELPGGRGFRDLAPIVLVDPDEHHHRAVRATLHTARVVNTVVRATCLADLGRRGHEPRPAAVLTASTLPDGSCLDVLEEVRSRLAWRRTPVVVLGHDDDEALIAEVHERGAAAYLSWPVATAGLIDVLRGTGLPWALAPVS